MGFRTIHQIDAKAQMILDVRCFGLPVYKRTRASGASAGDAASDDEADELMDEDAAAAAAAATAAAFAAAKVAAEGSTDSVRAAAATANARAAAATAAPSAAMAGEVLRTGTPPDDGSPSPPLRLCLRIHPEDESYSDLSYRARSR